MSGWARPRNLLIGGGVLAALAFVPTPGSKTTYAIKMIRPSYLYREDSMRVIRSDPKLMLYLETPL